MGRTEPVVPVRDRGSAGEGRPGQHRDSGPCEGQCRGGIRALGRAEAVAPVRDRVIAGKGRPGQERDSGPCEGQGHGRGGTPWAGLSQWPL